MFVRNGQALGSVLHSAAPKARPKPQTEKVEPPRKRGRPRKTVEPADLRTDTERYADEQAAQAREEIADGDDTANA